ncbi:MAG: class I SAM-dependent methyltransferase [Actinomycetota bacterium]|nr:class I SAM-dependent methyltransferase [Actinomycetota bacterium]
MTTHDNESIDFRRLYAYRHRGVDQGARQAVWAEIGPFIHGLMQRPQRVLDPAAGRGEFVNSISAAERWVVDSVAYDEAELHPEVKVVTADIFHAQLPGAYFDGIFVSNLLEHFDTQRDIARFLRRMFDCATDGASIAVMGPNFKYCRQEYFDCADHILALTHIAVEEHLFAAGFEIERVVPRFLPYSFRGILPPSPVLTRAYLRTPMAWRVLGKQFLVLARKPTSG